MDRTGTNLWWIVGFAVIVAFAMVGFGYLQSHVQDPGSFGLLEPTPVYEVRIQQNAERVCLEGTTKSTPELMSRLACR
ncbi:MAG: hypothetical protein ACPGOV_13415 [Magnetovibrionaceae bacterium]